MTEKDIEIVKKLDKLFEERPHDYITKNMWELIKQHWDDDYLP